MKLTTNPLLREGIYLAVHKESLTACAVTVKWTKYKRGDLEPGYYVENYCGPKHWVSYGSPRRIEEDFLGWVLMFDPLDDTVDWTSD
jgi:hypothetical protein